MRRERMEMNAIATMVMRGSFERSKMVLKPPVAAQPGERSFNHPADASRDEPSVTAAGEAGQGSAGVAGGIARRGDRLDRDAERLIDFGQPLVRVAEITHGWTLEAAFGERAQNRDNAFRIMPVRW